MPNLTTPYWTWTKPIQILNSHVKLSQTIAYLSQMYCYIDAQLAHLLAEFTENLGGVDNIFISGALHQLGTNVALLSRYSKEFDV